jgi:hypothetical protein
MKKESFTFYKRGSTTAVLSPKNIETVVASLRKQIGYSLPKDFKPISGILVPVGERILSKRYRGKGRPRKVDYDFQESELYKIAKSVNRTTLRSLPTKTTKRDGRS